MSHPTFVILAAAALVALVAVVAWCVWADARVYRADAAERAAGVAYVWDGTHLRRVEPATAPVLVSR